MTRKYQETHPWISFKIDLRQASPKFWMILGECQSKVQHLAKVPLRPSTQKELHALYLAKGVQATTAIEGNTLTEEQVREHLKGQLQLPPSQQYLKQEIENVRHACNKIVREVSTGNIPCISTNRITELNQMMLKSLDLNEDVQPGRLREHSVTVGAVYRGAPAEDLPFLMDELANWLESDNFKPTGEFADYGIVLGVLKAIVAHLYLAWIHPFGDGNGRTARLLEFQILLVAGVPAPAAHLLSNHYNQTRTVYYQQLDRASRSGGEVMPFIQYAIEGFLDGLREQLEYVWKQHLDIVWRNYVHELFKEKSGSVAERQRHLVLDLSRAPEPVAQSQISELSPRLIKTYATKGAKTIIRDLNELTRMELIEKDNKGHYRARTELVFSFLPAQIPNA